MNALVPWVFLLPIPGMLLTALLPGRLNAGRRAGVRPNHRGR